MVSENLNAFYFHSGEQLTPEAPPGRRANLLYPEEVQTGKLRFIAAGRERRRRSRWRLLRQSGRGRVLFRLRWDGGRAGGSSSSAQVYRYDNAEDMVQCMSCASPFDAEPKLGSYFLFGRKRERGGPVECDDRV